MVNEKLLNKKSLSFIAIKIPVYLSWYFPVEPAKLKICQINLICVKLVYEKINLVRWSTSPSIQP
jgi:hypothetical protein